MLVLSVPFSILLFYQKKRNPTWNKSVLHFLSISSLVLSIVFHVPFWLWSEIITRKREKKKRKEVNYTTRISRVRIEKGPRVLHTRTACTKFIFSLFCSPLAFFFISYYFIYIDLVNIKHNNNKNPCTYRRQMCSFFDDWAFGSWLLLKKEKKKYFKIYKNEHKNRNYNNDNDNNYRKLNALEEKSAETKFRHQHNWIDKRLK